MVELLRRKADVARGYRPKPNSAEDRRVDETIDPTVDVGIPKVYYPPLFLQDRHRRIR
jgi:hypothetical protein